MLTIFTCPKPFEGHIGIIQENAVRSWMKLPIPVEIILFGDEPGIAEVSEWYGVRHIRDIKKNRYGTPLLNDVFEQAYCHAVYTTLCYVNADIILLPDIILALRNVQESICSNYLLVGQRWDLDTGNRVNRHPPLGSDFFVFPKETRIQLPPFAIGRAGWDNWMIYHALKSGITVIDISPVTTVIHQNHSYNHIKDGTGQAYENPESDENLKIVKGSPFTLQNVAYTLTATGLEYDEGVSLHTHLKLLKRVVREMMKQ